MNLNLNKTLNPIDFGNGWGIYVDIENQNNPPICNYEIMRKKYIKNEVPYKEDYEYEYYQYEFYKKQKNNYKIIDESSLIKTNTSSLLFHISSVTLVTAALSYCIIVGL